MANRPVVNKDGALEGALTVTASSTTYSTGVDLKDQDVTLLDLNMIVELSDRASSASVIFELLGDSALPIDASSTTYLTSEAITADGLVYLPIPQDFSDQYVGVKCTESAGGTYTANTFVSVDRK